MIPVYFQVRKWNFFPILGILLCIVLPYARRSHVVPTGLTRRSHVVRAGLTRRSHVVSAGLTRRSHVVHPGREGMTAGGSGSWSHCVYSRCGQQCTLVLSLLSCLFHLGPPPKQRCHPHSGWVLPVRLDLLEPSSQSCVSMMILSSIKLTMKTESQLGFPVSSGFPGLHL